MVHPESSASPASTYCGPSLHQRPLRGRSGLTKRSGQSTEHPGQPVDPALPRGDEPSPLSTARCAGRAPPEQHRRVRLATGEPRQARSKAGGQLQHHRLGSQPAFHLLIYLCPNFPPSSPSLRYFWADHNTIKERQTAMWLALEKLRHLHALSSPTLSSITLSQARLRNLLLLFLFQTLKPTGKPELNLTAAEYS